MAQKHNLTTQAVLRSSITLAESIRIQIEREIVECHFKPGEKLDEEVLAARLATSRTPVREALRALASVGMVTIQPRVGATVAKHTVSEVMELFEVVAEMEAVAARLACSRADDTSRNLIAQRHTACEEQAASGTAESYYDANNLFHSAIWEAADNQSLLQQITLLNRRLSPYRRFITFDPGRKQDALAEHSVIASAIHEGNESAATIAMREHIALLGDDVLLLARNLRL